MPSLNGLDLGKLEGQVAALRENPDRCKDERTFTAEWVGGTRAKVSYGDAELYIGGGAGEFGAMSATTASFLACEIDLLATRATLSGIELEKLTLEGSMKFDLSRYMGVADHPGPGMQGLGYTVRIKGKNATREQVEELVKLCETSSPVGETLTRKVPVHLDYVIEE